MWFWKDYGIGTLADCHALTTVDFRYEIASGFLDNDSEAGSFSRTVSKVECTVGKTLSTTLSGSMPGGM